MADSKSILSDFLKNIEVLWLKTLEDMESWYPVTRKLAIFILMTLLALGLPFIAVVVTVFSVYKLFVFCMVKMCRPDLVSFMPSPGAMLAQEYSMDKSSKFNILTLLVLDGDISINYLRTCFQTRVINKRNDHGEREYPELWQYWTSYLGHFFWKMEDNFNLQQHIRVYDYCEAERIERVDPQGLQKLIAEVLPQPWRDGYSPWEILLIPNYYDSIIDRPQTVLMFRIHHAMGDGYSIMRLTFNDLAQVQPKIPNPSRPKATLSEKIYAIVTLPIRLLYDVAEIGFESIDSIGAIELVPPEKKREYHVCFTSERYEIEMIKAIKNKYDVSFNSVVCAAMCGAIRRALQAAGRSIPPRYSCGIAYPLPNRPRSGLINHAFLFFNKWPIGMESREERLRTIFGNMNKSKFYTGAIFNWFIMKLLSVTPNTLQWLISINARSTIAASFFPGPEEPFDYLGCTPTDIMFTVGLPAGRWGVFCTSLSLFGKQRFVINLDKEFFPSEKIVQQMGGYITHELEELLNSPTKHKLTSNIDKKIN